MSDQVSIQDQQQQTDVSAPVEPVEEIMETADITASPQEDEIVKIRMDEMEKEAAKLRELHSQLSSEQPVTQTDEEKRDIDSRSVYVGNVDYQATPLELQQHFSSAGVVHRVTILMNKFTGQPKGYAYLEFADADSVNQAVATLDASMFRDRELKVSAKRTNIPGLSTTNRGGFQRGGFRGGRGRGGPRGGRGRGRGRGQPRFTPY